MHVVDYNLYIYRQHIILCMHGGDVHISNIMAIATSVNLHCMYLTIDFHIH